MPWSIRSVTRTTLKKSPSAHMIFRDKDFESDSPAQSQGPKTWMSWDHEPDFLREPWEGNPRLDAPCQYYQYQRNDAHVLFPHETTH